MGEIFSKGFQNFRDISIFLNAYSFDNTRLCEDLVKQLVKNCRNFIRNLDFTQKCQDIFHVLQSFSTDYFTTTFHSPHIIL